ncbi:MAG: TonB-dependent receptor plug domain-containing protein [Sphingomonadaceae bacterium]
MWQAITVLQDAGAGAARVLIFGVISMRIAHSASYAALLVSCAASPALAQTLPAPDDQIGLDASIIVTANRTERRTDQIGQSVTVIDEQDIITRQNTDVVDLLRTVPGVSYSRNGGTGGVAGVSIRGAQSAQTVVLIDGIKLNDPASPAGGFDFGPMLTGNISRIEIVRGSQSVLYGSQAMGGVVNMITRGPTDEPTAFVSAEYGGRDSTEIVGNVSNRFGPVGISLGGHWARSDGISAFSEDRGGLERDRFRSYGANGKLDIHLTDGIALDLRGFYADSITGIDGFPPPFYSFADTADLSKRKDYVGYAGLKADFWDGRLRNRIGYAYTRTDRHSVDPSSGTDVETFAAEGTNNRYEYQGVFDAADVAQLVFGAEREESDYRTSSYGGPMTGGDAWTNSVYGQVNLSILNGLSLSGGVRYDDHENFGGETSFSASGAWAFNNGASVIRASYGEGFKAPSLFQLLSDYGNSALRPERSKSWDIGISHRFAGDRAEIGVTRFDRSSKDLIAYVSCWGSTDPICTNRPFGTYDNIESASAEGWEVTLALQPVDGFDISANYTRLESRDDLTGNWLARQARDKVSLNADYRWQNGLAAGLSVLMAGDSFDNAANTVPLDGYTLTDIRASYALGKGIELYGRVENLFDVNYETAFQYGQKGRTAYGGVRLRM